MWHTSRYRLVVTRWPLTLTLACANCCRDHCLVQNRSASYLNLIKPVCCSKCCPSDLNSTFFTDISKGFAEIAQSLKLPSLQNQGLQVLPSDKYPLLSISAVAGISSQKWTRSTDRWQISNKRFFLCLAELNIWAAWLLCGIYQQITLTMCMSWN